MVAVEGGHGGSGSEGCGGNKSDGRKIVIA